MLFDFGIGLNSFQAFLNKIQSTFKSDEKQTLAQIVAHCSTACINRHEFKEAKQTCLKKSKPFPKPNKVKGVY